MSMKSSYVRLVEGVILLCFLRVGAAGVVELGSEFHDPSALAQPHLVMFYAPWCGHCQSLHPTWHEVGEKLSVHPITVAKLDATIYKSAAEKYEIRGFPTIRLISKDRVLDYNGERTTDALVNFAKLGSRPLLTTISSPGKFNDYKRTEDVIFMLKNPSDELRACLQPVASAVIHEALITEIVSDAVLSVRDIAGVKVNTVTELRPNMSVSRQPGIAVYKDNKLYEYTGDIRECLDISLWIKDERFTAFHIGSYPTIHPLLFLSFNIVFYYGTDSTRISELVEMSRDRTQYEGEFYFIHIKKAEYIENLVNSYVSEGSVIIYSPSTEVYSYTTNSSIPVGQLMFNFVNEIGQFYGGTSFSSGIKKVAYRLHYNIYPMFADHPFIMALVIMIPIGLISLCFCCDNSSRSKHDPIRKILEDESQMDLLWNASEENDMKVKNSEDHEEEKSPELKKKE